MAKKKKKKKSNVVLNIFIALVFLAGAGVFLYPTISDMWNQYRNAQLVSKYEEAVTELSDNDYDRLWKEAKEYNAEHPVNAIVDAFEEEDTYELSHPYDRVLDPNGDGLMGSIEIPKIKARLAIYHGLSKTVLEKGVGHVEGTSLPIGGKSTHAVLAAHRGLPNAKLFTDLDQMKTGDLFFLNVLGEKLGSTRQIKSDVNYYILLHSQLPTIISECGFLSNPEEEQRLCTEEYQERIADALYCGIIEYLMMNMN